jgi:alkanesulfonate monooxygenase SsuD/methylene tetrahydromethanopterin reductase-like flavin-dependent oxidoreductase (luciferase family)
MLGLYQQFHYEYGSAMRFGVVILPELRWSTGSDIWRRAEDLGFDHAWTYDHLAWRTLRDSPWFATVPVLTAAATVTSRIRLGTLVASPNFRHPVVFAKELMTLDDISGGRITAGIGAGGFGYDSVMISGRQLSAQERSRRFREFVELADLLLRDHAANFTGEHYVAVEARCIPGCVQLPRVPFAIAATGNSGMALAASYGASWVTTGDVHTNKVLEGAEGPGVVGRQIESLHEACAKAGRAPESIDCIVLTGFGLDSGLYSKDAFVDTVARYEEVGVTDYVVHWPRAEPPFYADPATFEEIFESL